MRRPLVLAIGLLVIVPLAGSGAASGGGAVPLPHLVTGPDEESRGGVMAPEQVFAEGHRNAILVWWRMFLPVAYVNLGNVSPDGNYRFEVWRAEGNGTLTFHDTTPWTQPYYVDHDVPYLLNHTYAVRVVREDGMASAFSPNVTAQACPWDYGYCETSYRQDPEREVPYLEEIPVWAHVPDVGAAWDVAYEVIADVWTRLRLGDLACEEPRTTPCVHPTDDVTVNGTGCTAPTPDQSWVRVPCAGGAWSLGGNATCEGGAVCTAGSVQGIASCSGPCPAAVSTHGDAVCHSDTYAVREHAFYTPQLQAAPPCVAASALGDTRCTGSSEPVTQWYILYSQTPSTVCVAASGFGDATCRTGDADLVPTRALRAQAPPTCIAVSAVGDAACEAQESGAKWRGVPHENEGRRGPGCVAFTQFGTARCALEAENTGCAAVSGFGSAVADCGECVAVALEDATATCEAVSDGFTYRGMPSVCAAVSVLGHASCALTRDGGPRECVGVSALGPATCNGEPCGSGSPVLDQLDCHRVGFPCGTPGPAGTRPADTSRCGNEEARVSNTRFAIVTHDDCEEKRGLIGYAEYSEHLEVRAFGGSYRAPYTCLEHANETIICS